MLPLSFKLLSMVSFNAVVWKAFVTSCDVVDGTEYSFRPHNIVFVANKHKTQAHGGLGKCTCQLYDRRLRLRHTLGL